MFSQLKEEEQLQQEELKEVLSIQTKKLKLLVLDQLKRQLLFLLKCSTNHYQGQAGDNVGILLRGLKKEDIERGQVLAKPGSITPHTEFAAQIYVLTKEEGGRHTPFFSGYKPQFFIRTADITGDVILAAGTEMVMPGDTVEVTVKLIVPVALEEKQGFAIREGGKTVGAGAITKIIK